MNLDSLIHTLQHLGNIGYWLIFLISLLESLAFVGSIVPGTVLIVFAGFLAAEGQFDIFTMLWFAIVGAIAGDFLSFYVGSRGTSIFNRKGRFFNKATLIKGRAFFKKHGSKSVFFGRFIGPIRAIVPFVAGVSGMRITKFLLWNITSAFLWASFYLFLGYFFGGAFSALEMWSGRISIFITVLAIILICLWFLIRKFPSIKQFFISIGKSVWTAIASNPDALKLYEKHKRAFQFARARFERESFFGMPFTLLIIIFTIAAFLLMGTIEDIISSDPIVSVDKHVAGLLYAFRTPSLIKVFTWITLLAKWQVMACTSTVAILLFIIFKKRMYVIPFLVSIAGTELFCWLGKIAFHRPRPNVAFYTEHLFSFPSGHAATSVAIFGFIAYVMARELKGLAYKLNSVFFAIAIIFAIGISRLYLGVHFLSDVWGGYLLGMLWLITSIALLKWMEYRPKSKPSHVIHPLRIKLRIAFIFIFTACWTLFYVNFAMHYNPTINFPKTRPYVSTTFKTLLQSIDKHGILKFTEDIAGRRQMPFSFIILARDDAAILSTMKKAKWTRADRGSLRSLLRLAKASLTGKHYSSAPIAPSFWGSRPQDFGFEMAADDSSKIVLRHRVRFWKTRMKTPSGLTAYIGTAGGDTKMKWILIHSILPDIDSEREFLFNTFITSGFIKRFKKIRLVQPTMGKNFMGDPFFTDGQAYVIEITFDN